MTDDTPIIEFIKKELIINNTLNSAKVRWMKYHPNMTAILQRTSYLNKKVKFTERIYHIINSLIDIPKCVCGKNVRFISINSGYSMFCKSSSCARKSINWKSSSEKKKNSNIELLSEFKNFIQQNNELVDEETIINFINNRIAETDSGRKHQFINIKHYRKNSRELFTILKLTEKQKPFNLTDIDNFKDFEFSERMYLIHYKIDNIELCENCKENKRQYISFIKGYSRICVKKCHYNLHTTGILTEIEKQGFSIENNILNLKESKFQLCCHKCGANIQKTLTNGRWKDIYCEGCYGDKNISKEETGVLEYVESLNHRAVQSFKYDGKKEIDIFISDRNLGIEYNGVFWHSTDDFRKIPEYKKKHLDKTIECEERGWHLLHIFSSEWKNPILNDIWKSIISTKLGHNLKIYARQCSIKSISSEICNKFLDINHLQGRDHASVRYGLYHNDELISVMTFCKTRFNKNYEWELSRFCNKKYTNVIGGASRLFKMFTKNYFPKSIITYANRRYSKGNLYDKLGFKKITSTPPNYFYFQKEMNLLSRMNFQKHRLKNILPNFDETLSEYENMLNNKYRILFDCGNLTYSMTFN